MRIWVVFFLFSSVIACAPGSHGADRTEAEPPQDGHEGGQGGGRSDEMPDSGSSSTTDHIDGAPLPSQLRDAEPAMGDVSSLDRGLVCDPRWLMCDDFEQGALGMQWSPVRDNGGTVTVDGTRAFHGRRSVRLATPETNNSGAGIRLHQALRGLKANRLWGRGYFFFARRTPTNHVDYIRGEGRTGYVAVGAYDNAFAGFYYGPSGDYPSLWFYKGTKRLIKDGGWVCLEWSFDGVAGRAEAMIDGMELPQTLIDRAPDNKAVIFPSFDALFLVVPRGHEVWIDAVAVDDERVGCPS